MAVLGGSLLQLSLFQGTCALSFQILRNKVVTLQHCCKSILCFYPPFLGVGPEPNISNTEQISGLEVTFPQPTYLIVFPVSVIDRVPVKLQAGLKNKSYSLSDSSRG